MKFYGIYLAERNIYKTHRSKAAQNVSYMGSHFSLWHFLLFTLYLQTYGAILPVGGSSFGTTGAIGVLAFFKRHVWGWPSFYCTLILSDLNNTKVVLTQLKNVDTCDLLLDINAPMVCLNHGLSLSSPGASLVYAAKHRQTRGPTCTHIPFFLQGGMLYGLVITRLYITLYVHYYIYIQVDALHPSRLRVPP